MATTPDVIRRALLRLTSAARREIRSVAQMAPQEPESWRAALFAAAPLIVSEYSDGTAALALDWFEDIRFDASPPSRFTPTPLRLVTDEDVAAAVARSTEALVDPGRIEPPDLDRVLAESLAAIEAELQREVAQAFRDTMTANTTADPDAVGWQRFARDGGCKFCLMLAARGAIYTQSSVRFAAHKNCSCVVGQSYDPDAPRADVMQYLASTRRRTDADRARVRKYLNENFPDAPG